MIARAQLLPVFALRQKVTGVLKKGYRYAGYPGLVGLPFPFYADRLVNQPLLFRDPEMLLTTSCSQLRPDLYTADML